MEPKYYSEEWLSRVVIASGFKHKIHRKILDMTGHFLRYEGWIEINGDRIDASWNSR